MEKINLIFLLLFIAGNYLFAQSSFKLASCNFILNGKHTKIYSDEIQNTRILPDAERKAIKIKAAGLNTIRTYA